VGSCHRARARDPKVAGRAMDDVAVNEALALDPEWESAARRTWVGLMELVVWGELNSSRLGAVARLRKRALEVGEGLRSLTASRDWIPRSRERLKNALASALNLRESLQALEGAAQSLDGGADRAALRARIADLRRLLERLEPLENRWAVLLDAQHREKAP
jgi:hypothetical protein